MDDMKNIIYQLEKVNCKKRREVELMPTSLLISFPLTTNLSFCIRSKYLYNI